MRGIGYLALAAAAIAPWAIGGRYVLHVATMLAIMAMLALSMNLMLRIGQLSMAHGAFMGMGAYTSALLTLRAGVGPVVALLLSACLTAAVAVLFGRIFLRVKGVYFVLLTYAFGQIVNLIFQEGTGLFGGNNGLNGIPKFSFLGVRITDPASYYLLVLAFAVATLLLVRAILNSSVGVVLSAIDEDEDLSRSLGTNALAWRTAVFGLSAGLAGVAGSLYAHHLGFLSPSAFGFGLSVDLVVMNIIGGVASPWGPLVGALIVVPLPEVLRGIKEYQLLTYGLILLGFLMFCRDGLVGLVGRWRGASA
ncbi:MAG: branched-chain amino acid transporter permease [Rhodoferax sp.]|nr:branched-chain amino acid transporter permease [Rhodoferax sp.]